MNTQDADLREAKATYAHGVALYLLDYQLRQSNPSPDCNCDLIIGDIVSYLCDKELFTGDFRERFSVECTNRLRRAAAGIRLRFLQCKTYDGEVLGDGYRAKWLFRLPSGFELTQEAASAMQLRADCDILLGVLSDQGDGRLRMKIGDHVLEGGWRLISQV